VLVWTFSVLMIYMSAWMKLVLLFKKIFENDHSKCLFSMVFRIYFLKYFKIIDHSCKLLSILSFLITRNILMEISAMETGPM
jgi:hypothetical protein